MRTVQRKTLLLVGAVTAVTAAVALPSLAAGHLRTASAPATRSAASTGTGGVAADRAALGAAAAASGASGASGAGSGSASTDRAPAATSAAAVPLSAAPAGHVVLGAAATTADFANPTTLGALHDGFGVVTSPGDFLWTSEEPSRGATDLQSAEDYVLLAKSQGLKVDAGHLVWGHVAPSKRYPDYLDSDTPTQLLADLKEHITAEMTPFASGPLAGTISSWTVVNEPFGYDMAHGNLETDNVFYARLGESYITTAFKDARAADPNAQLCINEVHADRPGVRSDAYFALVQRLLKEGAPIDCVGFQGHLTAPPTASDTSYSAAALRANIARFAALRNARGQLLHVRFTEVDVPLHDDGVHPVDPAQIELQAQTFAHFAEACASVSTCDELTTWGIDDGESWVGNQWSSCGAPYDSSKPVSSTNPNCGAALLFDDLVRPKPAYAAVMRALGQPEDLLLTRSGSQLTSRGGTVVGPALTLASPGATASTGFTAPFAGVWDVGVAAFALPSLADPHLTVSVDGRGLCRLDVASIRGATAQTCGARLTEGTHTVSYLLADGSGVTITAATLGERNPLTAPRVHTGGYATAAGWLFDAPGVISVPLVTEQETTGTLQLDTRTLSAAVPTTITVAVDATTVLTRVVSSSTGTTLSIPVPLAAGSHLVTIAAAAGSGASDLAVGNLQYAASAVVADTDVGSGVYTAITGITK